MAYREQEVSGLCKVCREATRQGCLRCGDPLCQLHMPPEGECCLSCENLWLEKAARSELGGWGVGSIALVKIAKWAGRAGGLGVVLGMILTALDPSLLLWAPVALLLVGFPVAAATICALPFVRAGERAAAKLATGQRQKFLSEVENHTTGLLTRSE